MIEIELKLTNHLKRIKNTFKDFFTSYNAKFNESINNTSPHILNVTLPGIKANTLLKKTRNLSYSLGSACTSETLDPSTVLTSMGITKEDCFCSFRLSFSSQITKDQIEIAKDIFASSIESEKK